jgi:hypothetical protein
MSERPEGTDNGLPAESEGVQIRPEEVRSELERIFANPDFKARETSKAVLRQLVEEKLAGRESQIEANSILAHTTNLPMNAGPELASIARIQVNQLRRSLKDYYLSTGAENPIRIEIPTDCCVPVFHPVNND